MVDPLLLTALLGFIGAATAFLNTVITMVMPGKKRRRRRAQTNIIKEGQSRTSPPLYLSLEL